MVETRSGHTRRSQEKIEKGLADGTLTKLVSKKGNVRIVSTARHLRGKELMKNPKLRKLFAENKAPAFEKGHEGGSRRRTLRRSRR
jgi:hypothetical protein